jgi:predicted phosphodiesterase
MEKPTATIRTQVALDYSRRFSDSPNKTVARALHACETALFPSVENARRTVQRIRGVSGESTEHPQIARDARPKGWKSPMLSLPKSRPDGCDPIDLLGDSTTLILSDVHIPYHDSVALDAAISYGQKRKCTRIILNGDFWDAHSLSKYCPDIRERDLKGEISGCIEFFAYLRSKFKKCDVYAKVGNHESRYERYLNQNAPVLLGVPNFSMPSVLQYERFGFTQIESTQIANLSGVQILHGHELQGGATSPVSPAKGLCDKLGVSAICGHHHQRSEHTICLGVPGDRRTISTFSSGCLAGLFPRFMPVNRWSHGFIIVDTIGDKEFHVSNHSVVDGKVY